MSRNTSQLEDFFDYAFSGIGGGESKWKGKYYQCLNELQKSNRALSRYSRLAKARRKQILALNNALDEAIKGTRGRRNSAPASKSGSETVILSNTTPPVTFGSNDMSGAPFHSSLEATASA